MLKNLTFGCHGITNRCFKINGLPMPFCARCLGSAIGHVLCIFNFFLFPLFPLWISGIGLLIMLIDWCFQNKIKLYHSNISRLITGILGGYAVARVGLHVIMIIILLFK